MSALAITRDLTARAVHLKFAPRPTTLQQTSAILRLLRKRFGEVDHFKNLRYDWRVLPNTCLVIFREQRAAEDVIDASPLVCRVEVGGGVHGDGVLRCWLEGAGAARTDGVAGGWEKGVGVQEWQTAVAASSTAGGPLVVEDALSSTLLDRTEDGLDGGVDAEPHSTKVEALPPTANGTSAALRDTISSILQSTPRSALSAGDNADSTSSSTPSAEVDPGSNNADEVTDQWATGGDQESIQDERVPSRRYSGRRAATTLAATRQRTPSIAAAETQSRTPSPSRPSARKAEHRNNDRRPFTTLTLLQKDAPPTSDSTSSPPAAQQHSQPASDLPTGQPASKPAWPRRSPHAPAPGTVLTFKIDASASSHRHDVEAARGLHHGRFGVDRKTSAARDLYDRVEPAGLRGAADFNLRKEGRQWRRVVAERDAVRKGWRSLRSVWEEGRRARGEQGPD